MSKGQKIVTTSLWGLCVVLMVALIAAWSGSRWSDNDPQALLAASTSPTTVVPDAKVPAFSLRDQDDKAVTDKDMQGQVWIAAFIFTRCAGSCPMMASKLSKLQTSIPDARVKLVSFSMDPEFDKPDILRKYADKYGATASRWILLTGDRSQIMSVCADLKLPGQLSDKPGDIIHSDKFVLIDRNGKAAGYYDGGDDAQVNKLAADAMQMAAKP